MSKHFSSVVRLVKGPSEGTRNERNRDHAQVTVHDDRKSLALPSLAGQPLPPSLASPGQKDEVFTVNHVFLSEEDSQVVYKRSVKEIVEGTLLGYHGTVISFGTQASSTLRDPTDGAICRAARQILRCLKKSRRSHSTANLTVRCSFVVVIDENVHDLLQGFEEVGGQERSTSQAAKKLTVLKGNVVGATIQEAKTAAKVVALLEFGAETEQKLLQCTYNRSPDSPTCHSVFQVTVAYTQFGSMNAPISGNLTFVDMGTAQPLAHGASGETKDQRTYLSLHTFADIVTALTPSTGELNVTSHSTTNLDDDTLLPNMPSLQASSLYSQSTLTQILKEALGGNCKTLLISHLPSGPITTTNYLEAYKTLRLAERARHIRNSPNKRDLAEKALMSAYMKELHRTYGKGGLGEVDGRAKPTHDTVEQLKPSLCGPKGDSMAELLTNEERKRNVELAASALAAAALNEGEDSSEEEGDPAASPVTSPTRNPTKTAIKLRKKRKAKKAKPAQLALLQGLESASSSSMSAEPSGDVTVDALVAILQHPDQGVPRASHTALKDVRIRKDVGALFSGADIVRWMVENVAGVEGEEEAERLGQLLLDKGGIIHSEESGVFANAESLFYYAAYAPMTTRMLSVEEIQALLAKTKEEPLKPNVTSINVTRSEEGKEGEEGGGSRGSRGETPSRATDQPGDLYLDDYDELSAEEFATTSPRPDPLTRAAPCPGESVGDEEGFTEPGSEQRLPPFSPSSGYNSENSLQEVTSPTGRTGCDEGTDGQVYSAVDELSEQEAAVTTQVIPYQEELEAEEQEVDREEQSRASVPDTAPVDTIPIIQTLENIEEYPHPLHMAVAIGKSPGVIRNLVMMFGVDKQDEQGRTPLMFAVLANKRSQSSTLIDVGANVDHCDSSGITAIQVACYHGHKEALSLLISKKASLDVVDKMGHSVLHWSTVPDSPSCMQLVVSRVSSNLVHDTDKRDLSALHWAIYYDHAEHLKLLLKRYENPLQLDSTGCTFMTYAIKKNASNCIQALVMSVPALLSHPDSSSLTPLHYASTKGSPVHLKLLLSFPVPKGGSPLDLNCTDQYNRTPLHCAAYCNRLQNALVLLNSGALQHVADTEGRTPMDYAKASEEGSQMVALLQGDSSVVNEELPETCANTELQTPNSKACTIL